MKTDGLQEVLWILNRWWRQELIPEDQLKARVILLHKRGATSNIDNYRPISLLNTVTKIFAGILKNRISEKIEDHLNKTQYGFRKDRSTTHAIHIVRRLIDLGERTRKVNGEKIHLILLDWEKAFDKVYQDELINAVKRMNIPEKMIKVLETGEHCPHHIYCRKP